MKGKAEVNKQSFWVFFRQKCLTPHARLLRCSYGKQQQQRRLDPGEEGQDEEDQGEVQGSGRGGEGDQDEAATGEVRGIYCAN